LCGPAKNPDINHPAPFLSTPATIAIAGTREKDAVNTKMKLFSEVVVFEF
jgi:hypothetical protein